MKKKYPHADWYISALTIISWIDKEYKSKHTYSPRNATYWRLAHILISSLDNFDYISWNGNNKRFRLGLHVLKALFCNTKKD